MADDIAISASASADSGSKMNKVVCGPFTVKLLIIVCAVAVVVIVAVVLLLVFLLPGGTASCEYKEDDVLKCGGGNFGKKTFEGETFKNLEVLDLGSNDNKANNDAFDDLTELTMFEVSSDNKRYKAPSGVLYDKKDKKLVRVPIAHSGAKSLIKSNYVDLFTGGETVAVGNTKTVQSHAFRDLINIENFYIDTDLEKLETGAFGIYYDLEFVDFWDLDTTNLVKDISAITPKKSSGFPTDLDFDFELDEDVVPKIVRDNIQLKVYEFHGLEEEGKEGLVHGYFMYKTKEDELIFGSHETSSMWMPYTSDIPVYVYNIVKGEKVPIPFKGGKVENVKFTFKPEGSLEELKEKGMLSYEIVDDILFITFKEDDYYVFRVDQNDIKCEASAWVVEEQEDIGAEGEVETYISQFPAGSLDVDEEYTFVFYNFYNKNGEIYYNSDVEPMGEDGRVSSYKYGDNSKGTPKDFTIDCKQGGSELGYHYCKVKVLNKIPRMFYIRATSTNSDGEVRFYDMTSQTKKGLQILDYHKYISGAAPAGAQIKNLGKDGKIEFCIDNGTDASGAMTCSSKLEYTKGKTDDINADKYTAKCTESDSITTCLINLNKENKNPGSYETHSVYVTITDNDGDSNGSSTTRTIEQRDDLYIMKPQVGRDNLHVEVVDGKTVYYMYPGETFGFWVKYPWDPLNIEITDSVSSKTATAKLENGKATGTSELPNLTMDCDFTGDFTDDGGSFTCSVLAAETIEKDTEYKLKIKFIELNLEEEMDFTLRKDIPYVPQYPKLWKADSTIIDDDTTYVYKLSNMEEKGKVNIYVYDAEDYTYLLDGEDNSKPIGTLEYTWNGTEHKDEEPKKFTITGAGDATFNMSKLNDFGRTTCTLDLPESAKSYMVSIITCINDDTNSPNNCIDFNGQILTKDTVKEYDTLPTSQLGEFTPLLNATSDKLTSTSTYAFEIDNLLSVSNSTSSSYYSVEVKLAGSNKIEENTPIYSTLVYKDGAVTATPGKIDNSSNYPSELASMKCEVDSYLITTTCTLDINGYLGSSSATGTSSWYAFIDAKNVIKQNDTEVAYQAYSINTPSDDPYNHFAVPVPSISLNESQMGFTSSGSLTNAGTGLSIVSSNFNSNYLDKDKKPIKYSKIELTIVEGSNTDKYTYSEETPTLTPPDSSKVSVTVTLQPDTSSPSFMLKENDGTTGKTYKITVKGTRYDKDGKQWTFTSVGSFAGAPVETN